jgi:hypothetical protein
MKVREASAIDLASWRKLGAIALKITPAERTLLGVLRGVNHEV